MVFAQSESKSGLGPPEPFFFHSFDFLVRHFLRSLYFDNRSAWMEGSMRRSGADRGHRAARGRAMGVYDFRAPFAAYECPMELFEQSCRGEMWVVADSGPQTT